MAQTCTDLISDVKALCGRTSDSVLITDARVLVWLNEAQRDIADNVPGLHELTKKNVTSLECTATLKWSLADLTFDFTYDNTTDNHCAHTFSVFYKNGLDSEKLTYIPIDEFDECWPDPTHSDVATSKCNVWTRRGEYVEIMPICNTGWHDITWRFDVGIYPRDFTGTSSTDTSDLNDADDMLKAYSAWHAFAAMGVEKQNDAIMWKLRYYELLEKFRDKNDTMPEWQGNWFVPVE